MPLLNLHSFFPQAFDLFGQCLMLGKLDLEEPRRHVLHTYMGQTPPIPILALVQSLTLPFVR